MSFLQDKSPLQVNDLLELAQGRLNDPLWRLSHLYWIEDKQGKLQRFRPNAAQLRLHGGMGRRNAILKARQLGISTYVALLMLDYCLFTPNFHAGIIDKSLPDGEQKLEKIRFAWEHLDYLPTKANDEAQALARLGRFIKERCGQTRNGRLSPCTDTRSRMSFANGSDIRLGTTLRGGTLQMLHISELAHVSVHSPWRAREIRSGAINTVSSDGLIILESTHEGGRYGVNYDIMAQAMENRAKRADEWSSLDFHFFFLSWFDHADYQLTGKAGWSDRMAQYFEKLERELGITLRHSQKLWYSRMERTMGAAMKQEYPSSPDEAFAAGNEGAIYGRELTQLREAGQIGTPFSAHPEHAIYTSWDLGLSDHTAIWLIQEIGGKLYWLNHYAANQQPLEHFVAHIYQWEKRYGRITLHFLPHDAAHRDPHGQSYVESLAARGITRVRVVPRTPDIWRGINTLRQLLVRSWFHPDTLKGQVNLRGEQEPSGLRCLENYRCAPVGSGGSLKEAPLHDAHSHSADAARTFAEAYSHHLLDSGNLGPCKRARM